MILYFSSTGNCKYIAETLANGLGDRAASISESERICLSEGERLGFVFPTYFWRLPSVVDEYMKKLSVTLANKAPYTFFVATFGTTCGQTGTFMKRHLKKKGISLSAAYSIKTVDDYTVLFDLSDKSKVDAALETEKKQTAAVLQSIKQGKTGNMMKGKLPMIAVVGSGLFYNRARRTKHFRLTDGCISCGICEKECPISAIKIQNGKPVWVKEKCALCLHCLHFCPKFAIQYEDKTQAHGQYKHP